MDNHNLNANPGRKLPVSDSSVVSFLLQEEFYFFCLQYVVFRKNGVNHAIGNSECEKLKELLFCWHTRFNQSARIYIRGLQLESRLPFTFQLGSTSPRIFHHGKWCLRPSSPGLDICDVLQVERYDGTFFSKQCAVGQLRTIQNGMFQTEGCDSLLLVAWRKSYEGFGPNFSRRNNAARVLVLACHQPVSTLRLLPSQWFWCRSRKNCLWKLAKYIITRAESWFAQLSRVAVALTAAPWFSDCCIDQTFLTGFLSGNLKCFLDMTWTIESRQSPCNQKCGRFVHCMSEPRSHSVDLPVV